MLRSCRGKEAFLLIYQTHDRFLKVNCFGKFIGNPWRYNEPECLDFDVYLIRLISTVPTLVQLFYDELVFYCLLLKCIKCLKVDLFIKRRCLFYLICQCIELIGSLDVSVALIVSMNVSVALIGSLDVSVALIGSLNLSVALIGSWLWWLEQPATNGLPSERVFTAEQSGNTEGRQKERRRPIVFARAV